MSLFDLQDVCIAIGSIATLDLPMVVDLIGIYGLKGPYCTLTTTKWFLQALSVIPRGSWGDVARRFTMIRWASPELLSLTLNLEISATPPLFSQAAAVCAAAASLFVGKFVPDKFDEENPSALNSSAYVSIESYVQGEQRCLRQRYRWKAIRQEKAMLTSASGHMFTRNSTTYEVDITGDEEVDLVSSDVSTVYRSPSPIFQEVDSVEHDLQFALGPAIFPSVAQEERLYFVQSPASSPATYQPQESSSSSTDVSMHFDSADIPLNAQADSQASAPVDFTMFADALEDLRSSISQRIHDSNCEILSKVNAVEIGVREALLKQHALLHQSLQDACRVQERQGVTQAMQINDLKKGLLAPAATVFQDLMAIKKGQREQDAKITALDTQIAAIRSEQLDFQSKIAADLLSLSTQIGDIVDHIRGGDAKKGEIGSSSRRPPPVRVERRPLPTLANQGESSSGHGRVPSVEEAAEMVQEADRQADIREREREREKRLRRLRRRGH
ncbi:hypothetical protein F511_34972 [Dorcoceras hygrometricum]|uniref:Uncharacterized protein n=1 Tax=Dorcoceras hygrometricum TaxID=472368 RepID=A0A2Z7C7K0_9LAMI|nr:hypothetical protein F511_34972 [Dorcoceras hygrometricum]